MLCSNCGKNVPYYGSVCPHCLNDKTKDKKTHNRIKVCIYTGLVAGPLFGAFMYGWSGGIAGFFLGGIAGMCVGLHVRSTSDSAMPTHLQDLIITPIEDEKTRTWKQLSELERLRSQKMISDEVYQEKREKLLKKT